MKIKRIIANRGDELCIAELTDGRFALINSRNAGFGVQIADQIGGFLRYGFFEEVDSIDADTLTELTIVWDIRKDEAEAKYKELQLRR